MALAFNGSTLTYTNSSSGVIFTGVGITSFSVEGGDRTEVDVTQSTSTRREVLAGFASPRRLTFGVIFNDPTLAELDTMLGECGPGTLVLAVKPDCDTAAASFFSGNCYLMNYSLNGELDGTITAELTFMVNE